MKKPTLLTALFLGIAFDILFWDKTPGISFSIYAVLCLAGGYLLLRQQNIRPAVMSLALLAPILFFAVMSFNRLEPFTLLLNYVLTLFFMAVLAMSYRTGKWFDFGIIDYVVHFVLLAINMLRFGWSQIFNQDPRKPVSGERNPSPFWPIVRGIVIALPILLVFGALFASADLVFARKLEDLGALLSLQNLGEYIIRGVFILIAAYLLAGVFNYPTREYIRRDRPLLAPFLSFTEAAIILGSIVLLFSAFVVVQFQYFFSGQANISLEGFTYSEYARRGFGELVAVAALSLLLFQALNVITRRKTSVQKKVFSGLGIGLVALVIVILVSSFQRLYLYEAAYGFTRSRTYAHVFIIWLGLLLLTVVGLEVFNRQRRLAAAAVIILTGFAISLNILNVDAFIARQNIRIAGQGKELDASYLASLSNDAVPVLVKNFSAAGLDPDTRSRIEASLVCLDLKQKARSAELQRWQSFHFSNWNASRQLEIIRQQANIYKVQDDTFPVTITSPSGAEFTCPGY